jgi:hypothetical protein
MRGVEALSVTQSTRDPERALEGDDPVRGPEGAILPWRLELVPTLSRPCVFPKASASLAWRSPWRSPFGSRLRRRVHDVADSGDLDHSISKWVHAVALPTAR